MGTAYPGRLIFDHMPKTAGQAINDWLSTALGTAIVSPTLAVAHRVGIKRHGGEYSVISAHIYFEDALGLDPRYQYITCLRDPVERCLSWLYFVANNHDTESAIRNDVQLFLKREGDHDTELLRGQIVDLYVNHFCDIDGNLGGTREARVAQAVRAARRYNIVGFYDDLPRFVAETASLLGIPPPPRLPARNLTQSKPAAEQVPAALRERLTKLNKLDIDFYDEMKSSMSQKVSGRLVASSEFQWQRYDKPMLHAPTGGIARIIGVTGPDTSSVKRGDKAVFSVDLRVFSPMDDLVIGMSVLDQNGDEAFGTDTRILGADLGPLERGLFKAEFELAMELPTGSYSAGFMLHRDHGGQRATLLDRTPQACTFQVRRDVGNKSSGYASLEAAVTLISTSVMPEDAIVRCANGTMTVNSVIQAMCVAEEISVSVTVKNHSAEDWVGNSHVPVYLSYHWLTVEGERFVFDGLRSPLPNKGIAAGGQLDAEVAVLSPARVGSYQLVLTLVQEHVHWFEQVGFLPSRVRVDVKDSRLNFTDHTP